MNPRKAAGVLDCTSMPSAANRSCVSANSSDLRSIAFSRSMIGADVFAGTTAPHQVTMSKPGTPLSATVGMSGASGVRFALEVHPAEIAYDLVTAERALQALGRREEFGFNFDPSHLHWQGVDPVEFLRAFPDRIYHVHVKDAITTLNGRSGILSSHLGFGDPRRGWDFRSPGRGGIDFEAIIRGLNSVGYEGPLSVEWEDSGMDREHGAAEACQFVKNLDFAPAGRAFDAAFAEDS